MQTRSGQTLVRRRRVFDGARRVWSGRHPPRRRVESQPARQPAVPIHAVGIDDLDGALDEINTLMEVQVALQDASQGFLFLPCNGNLSEPWQE